MTIHLLPAATVRKHIAAVDTVEWYARHKERDDGNGHSCHVADKFRIGALVRLSRCSHVRLTHFVAHAAWVRTTVMKIAGQRFKISCPSPSVNFEPSGVPWDSRTDPASRVASF
ncbi:MAG TPA: hypothetical protein VKB36_14140 [Vicinamibacterales bacterium]|nr:hypothetical protein [Vicinamibacterales bacterium]